LTESEATKGAAVLFFLWVYSRQHFRKMFIIVGSEKIDRKVTGWTVIRKNGSVFIE
jgi:hypothetical protein